MNSKLTFKEYWPIMEMLDSEFESLTWAKDGNVDSGIGVIKDEKVKLTLSPITFESLQGLNLSFSTWDKNSSIFTERKLDVKIAAVIIGAVTNAFKERVSHYDWDFLTIIAKDHVDARMRLYTRIGERLSRELGLDRIDDRRGSNGVIIIGKREINLREIWSKIE